MRGHSTKELTLNRYLDDCFDLFYRGGEQYTNLKLKEDKFFELIYKNRIINIKLKDYVFKMMMLSFMLINIYIGLMDLF